MIKSLVCADRKADVNQTCQQAVFLAIGACIRIWCTVDAVEQRSQMFVYRPFRFSLSPVPRSTKGPVHRLFYIKGWALNLVLIQRPGGTRKWPIGTAAFEYISAEYANFQEVSTFKLWLVHFVQKNKSEVQKHGALPKTALKNIVAFLTGSSWR